MTSTVRHRPAANAAMATRELDTPYSDRDPHFSVATPSCCCCCSCCLTALTVVPVMIGVNTGEVASAHGRRGLGWGLLAGAALPATALAALIFVARVRADGSVSVVWFVSAAGLMAAARSSAGAGTVSAVGFGLIATVTWIALMIADFFFGLVVLVALGPYGLLLEAAAIPLWIYLIVRRSHRRRIGGPWARGPGGSTPIPRWPTQYDASPDLPPPPFDFQPPDLAPPDRPPPQDPYGP